METVCCVDGGWSMTRLYMNHAAFRAAVLWVTKLSHPNMHIILWVMQEPVQLVIYGEESVPDRGIPFLKRRSVVIDL